MMIKGRDQLTIFGEEKPRKSKKKVTLQPRDRTPNVLYAVGMSQVEESLPLSEQIAIVVERFRGFAKTEGGGFGYDPARRIIADLLKIRGAIPVQYCLRRIEEREWKRAYVKEYNKRAVLAFSAGLPNFAHKVYHKVIRMDAAYYSIHRDFRLKIPVSCGLVHEGTLRAILIDGKKDEIYGRPGERLSDKSIACILHCAKIAIARDYPEFHGNVEVSLFLLSRQSGSNEKGMFVCSSDDEKFQFSIEEIDERLDLIKGALEEARTQNILRPNQPNKKENANNAHQESLDTTQ